jgi:iron complex outermembrane receptor protein
VRGAASSEQDCNRCVALQRLVHIYAPPNYLPINLESLDIRVARAPLMSQLRANPFAIAGAKAIACALVFASVPMSSVRAQHASDDPVASANDSFGLTLGLESIGLYGPSYIRGFNPQVAGNVRIEGLYFDQQGSLSNRVVEGSTVRIGVNEIGYAFPAPTGIVDYDLRRPGNGTPSATIVASAGPFEARGVSIDGSVPLISTELQLPLGLSYQRSAQTSNGYPNPGYTSDVVDIGATPQWRPSDWLNIRGVFDWTQTTHAKTLPSILTGGDYLPPDTPRGYYGQNWAEGRSLSENYGGIVVAQLNRDWSLAAGIFRSIADNPISYSDLYLNTQPNGSAEQFIVGSPDQSIASTSGEARITGRFGTGSWRQDLVLLARGRDTRALYGGSDVINLGPAVIDQGIQVPQPTLSYSARTNDRTELWSAGIAYRAQWQERGDFALGVQQESYSKEVRSPDLSEAHLTDHPVRGYGTAALALSDQTTAYAGYTQGLEDSGVAPSSAENRGAVLPDARTWQADTGIRYLLAPRVKLIAGIFEIEKPYFNLDTRNVDRALGLQRATGLELSASGEVIKNLNVAAALLWGEVKVVGPNLKAEGVGSIALNQARVNATINASYALPRHPALSADLYILHFGPYPASVDNVVQAPGETLVTLGGRYRFKILGAPTTLRVEIQNLTNVYFWNLSFNSPVFSQYQPRAIFGYLTTDF